MRIRQFCIWLLVCVANVWSTAAALVSGHVRDEFGGARPGLVIRAKNQWSFEFQTSSAADGSYSMSLGTGVWEISAPHTNQNAVIAEYFDISYWVSVGASAITQDLTLPTLRSQLAGSLRDVFGEPLQLPLWFSAMIDGQQAYTTARPDTNGNFTVRLPNGTWSVTPDSSVVLRAGFGQVASQTFTLLNETNATVGFILSPATNIIRGRIVDDSGAPASNLTMQWSCSDGSSHQDATDIDGNYSFGAHPGRWSLFLDGLKERRLALPSFPKVTVAEEAPVTRCDVRVWRMPYDIHVRLVDENGNLSATSAQTIVQSTLDGEKIQLYAQIVGGKADIAVRPGSWMFLRPDAAALYTVNITQESVEATFVVHPTNSQSMFLGKVVDEQGVGIANLQIQATWNGPTNTTDANGNFEFLAPTGSTYPRLIDTNYLISSTPAAPAPDHPAERIITARRVTSALSLRLTFPEGFAQPGSVGARASTRIGGSSYYVNGDSGTNQIIRLPVFPGSWKVFANVPGVLVARPPVIEVGSGSEGVEVAVDLKPLPIASGSVRGRVVAPSGSPLKFFSVQALGDWFLGDSFPVVGATDEDGRFSRKANGKCDIIIYNGPMTASVAANVQDALETDLGTIQMPDCKVKAVVTFVDETGTPIKFSGYYWNWLRASCERAGAKFVVTNNGMDNPRSVLLTPGVWQIEAETEDEGYAIAAPLMLEVGQTDMRTNILLRRLQSPRAAPSINISAGADGLTLRAASASAKYVDIEASSDLKVWRYYSTQPMIGSQIDSTTPVSGGSPSLYFRAANADLPAAE